MLPIPSQGDSGQTLACSILHSLHGLVNLEARPINCRVSNFAENDGSTKHVLVATFDFVKKISIHVEPYFRLSFSIAKRCWVVVLTIEFFVICRLV